MTKILRKQKANITFLKDEQDMAISDLEKIEALARNYGKIHKTIKDFGDPEITRITNNLADNIQFSFWPK